MYTMHTVDWLYGALLISHQAIRDETSAHELGIMQQIAADYTAIQRQQY